MNRKRKERKVIVGIALATIMAASIFAMAVPASIAGTNGGYPPDETPASSIRIYGDVQPHGNAPARYINYKEAFDPTVIPKDSITYNPAIIEESREAGEQYYGITIGVGSSSQNAREKIFARSWYEPCGQYNGPRKNETHPTINMEFTYMLLNSLYLPITGTAPNTQFLVPTCEIDTQTGLGAWSGAKDTNLTAVASISGPAVAPSGETVRGEISLAKRLALLEGDKVQFFDHTVELTNIKEDGEFVIKVAYAGNAQDDSEKGWIGLNDGETIYFDRHNNEYNTANHNAATDHIRTWYVSRDKDTLIVGKELWQGDVFYVDAVRYEVTAVEVVDTNGDTKVDAFKYITLRTKLPKGVGSVRDESVVSTQFIDCIEPAELIPMLPPFNMNHDMVDDIDIPLWRSAAEERDWTRQDYAGTRLDTDGDGNWIAYDVNERVIDNIDPLEVTYIEEQVEERYSTNLLEKLQEEWKGKVGERKELFLVVDTSQNMVDDGLFELQIDGLVSAIDAIPQDGTVSVCVIQFSDDAKVEVPLTTITADTVNDIAAKMRAIEPIERNTNMSAAFFKVATVINESPAASTQIVDISSDGGVTEGDTMAGRRAAIDAGLDVINVFGIGKSEDDITEANEEFLQSLVYGDNGFYTFANESSDIVDKTEEKIRQEAPGLITESWTKFDVQSLPDQYTTFVLPELPDYYTIPIAGNWPVKLDGDYIITTSWIAPQARGDLNDNKRGTIPGDPNEQRVAFSYDPKDGEDGNDIYVYYDEELKMATIKIYGNDSDSTFGTVNSCNIEQYEDWQAPFNPTAIRKDSITFDAAILQYSSEYPMNAQNENVDLKEYLRAWYVPEYEFYGWHKMIGLAPAIVIEATYMLIDSQDKKPWHADVDSWFPFPIVSDPTTDQIGLDSFENPGVESVRKNLVRLANVSCDPDDIKEILPKTTNGTIRIEKTYLMEEGDKVQFIDHRLKFTGYGMSDTDPKVTLSYCGNTEDDAINVNVYLTSNNTFFDRHDSYPGSNKPTHPDVTWYARYDGRLKNTDKALITVGKELQRGDVFHVDGVRYEIPAIEVLDNNGNTSDGCEKFKYITLRTPLPKYLGDGEYTMGQQYLSCADSQWLTKVKICNPLPVLPPLNMEHKLVDDTDVVLWQPLKMLDKWPYGDVDTGKPGTEYFPCAERYLTMQYPPYAWLRYFRAVPIDTDGDMTTRIPSDWQLWEGYGGPFYPGDVRAAVPDGWQCCECGIPMPLPDKFTVFDSAHWIANDVDERIIGPVDSLKFCWKEEKSEPRYSTNLLEILDENGRNETWTKFDIQTIPDEFTRFKLYEIPSLNPKVYVGGEYQLTFEPDIRFNPQSKAQPGSYLITTSFLAPNAKGDLNREHSYPLPDRFAFTYNPKDGTGIYMNMEPVIPAPPSGNSFTLQLDVGQNYVSLPVMPEKRDTEAIFGRDVEVWAYKASTGWSAVSEVKAGKGYYVYNPWAPKTITVYGTGVSLTWQGIKGSGDLGWNLIGPGNESIAVPPDALILKYRRGFPYPYDFMSMIPGLPGEKLEPGQAYWTYKIA
ncbi:MAG: vWA domain-containing protein [Halobacteriota archaeon]